MVFVIFFALCFLPVIPECFYQGSRCFFWLCLKRKANCWIPALKTLPEWRSSGWCLLSFFALCFSLVIPECFYQGSRCFFWLCLKRKNNCWIPAQQRYRNDGLNTWIPALKTLPEWRSSGWCLLSFLLYVFCSSSLSAFIRDPGVSFDFAWNVKTTAGFRLNSVNGMTGWTPGFRL